MVATRSISGRNSGLAHKLSAALGWELKLPHRQNVGIVFRQATSEAGLRGNDSMYSAVCGWLGVGIGQLFGLGCGAVSKRRRRLRRDCKGGPECTVLFSSLSRAI
jgi:hypothetical protein